MSLLKRVLTKFHPLLPHIFVRKKLHSEYKNLQMAHEKLQSEYNNLQITHQTLHMEHQNLHSEYLHACSHRSALLAAEKNLRSYDLPNAWARINFYEAVFKWLGEKTTDTQTKLTLLQHLSPQSIDQDLIRIGSDHDGGYLLPNDLNGIIGCFSPGVGDNSTFEDMLATTYGMHIFLADYSVDAPPIKNRLFDFEKKYLGTANTGHHIRLEDWFLTKHKNISKDENDDYLLQMDIEGFEYSILLDTPMHILKKFRIMIIEFHFLDVMLDQYKYKLIESIFYKILQDFVVVHIHPNNNADIAIINGVEIPKIMEFTFYRRDRAKINEKKLTFPHMHDSPNTISLPDIVLPSCWQYS